MSDLFVSWEEYHKKTEELSSQSPSRWMGI